MEFLSFSIFLACSSQILLLLRSELLTERSHLDLLRKVISHCQSQELAGSLECQISITSSLASGRSKVYFQLHIPITSFVNLYRTKRWGVLLAVPGCPLHSLNGEILNGELKKENCSDHGSLSLGD